MSFGLMIRASGMRTAVGSTAAATCAAFRARLNNFAELGFTARGGDWIVGSEVGLDEPWRGIPRLAHLVVGPLRECLTAAAIDHQHAVPLLLAVAERDRPGRLDSLESELFTQISELIGDRFHEASRIIPYGRVSGVLALREAARLLKELPIEYVLIAGTDSYLVQATLHELDAAHRLLTATNSDGFIPGEAGAAVLIGRPRREPAELSCLSLGLATEHATIVSDQPLRGQGLRDAFHQALIGAGLEMAQIGYRIGTMSGEQYWFKEFELATTRLLRSRHEFMDLWHPADTLGEVGAASVPVILGIALEATRKRYAPGDPVLVSASNDDGRRAAVVLTGRPR